MATLNITNFPEPLYQALKARARAQHHSITQEAVNILSKALTETATPSIMELQGLGAEVWSGIDAARYVSEERDSWADPETSARGLGQPVINPERSK
ncbi:MAG TPA: hypothetical protein VFJ16_19625 [Longimicrobium sp.]|nr:hypothetical protein [Longimicrobium sp.]